MTSVACPSCGQRAVVEELAPASRASQWLRCGRCSHVWQRVGTESDAFSLIVGSPLTSATPTPGQRPAQGALRAMRFEVQLRLRFRATGDPSWQTGTTVNISQTGLLFRVQQPVPAHTALEILLELPVEQGNANVIRCDGHTVRSVPPVRPGAYASLAVVVKEYRVESGQVPNA